MTCVGLLGLAIGRGLKLNSPGSPPPGQDDLQILGGLAVLYATIGIPMGQMGKPITTRDIYPIQDIYFLWSLERVGMLFNLPTIGDKEWYRWGAEILVSNQLNTGEFNAVDWAEDSRVTSMPGFYGPILKTAFALLFLKHSHPMKDLTPKLPFTANELNKGVARLIAVSTPPKKSTDSPSRSVKPDR